MEYETRLIRSSPKRICGFITPADATTSPLVRSHRCAAMVVEPMSTANPKAVSCRPGQTPMICFSPWTATVTCQSPARKRGLQHLQHGQIAGEVLEAPFLFQGIEQPAQIPGRVVHVRLLDLHVMQPHDRIELDRARVGFLAHDLPMDLAARGHVDHHIREHAGGAGQAPAGGERLAPRIARLGLREGR